MIKKLLIIFGLSILLTSCKLNPVNRTIDYQNPNSELIKALLTEQEVSYISSEFRWYDIFFTQQQDMLDTDTSSRYEEAQSSYFGTFQNSDHSVMIFHTLHKYGTPIDKDKSTEFLLGGITTYGAVTSYIPDISASGVVVSKCSVEVETAKQICDVHVRYQYIESNVNITTYNIGKETIAEWLNAIVSIVEPRILAQDLGE
jgi:hypothetical protein